MKFLSRKFPISCFSLRLENCESLLEDIFHFLSKIPTEFWEKNISLTELCFVRKWTHFFNFFLMFYFSKEKYFYLHFGVKYEFILWFQSRVDRRKESCTPQSVDFSVDENTILCEKIYPFAFVLRLRVLQVNNKFH